ncbi:hypothetical protein ACFWAR_00300 [Streptomyces sp. NPDC059917]|uniref:hypothetical protein n=1 Tax=Streptomyces sp. NPDC059917 TaxID=3347002 RepID=UPI00364AA6BA
MLLASGDRSGVRVWNPLTGELRHSLLRGAPVRALAIGTGPTGPILHLGTVTLDGVLPHRNGCSHEIAHGNGSVTALCRDLVALRTEADRPDNA